MLLDLKQVAARLGVCYDSARDFVVSGKLQGVHLAGRRKYQVTEEDLEAFIEASKIGPIGGPQPPHKRPEMTVKHRSRNRRKPAPHAWREEFRRR